MILASIPTDVLILVIGFRKTCFRTPLIIKKDFFFIVLLLFMLLSTMHQVQQEKMVRHMYGMVLKCLTVVSFELETPRWYTVKFKDKRVTQKLFTRLSLCLKWEREKESKKESRRKKRQFKASLSDGQSDI